MQCNFINANNNISFKPITSFDKNIISSLLKEFDYIKEFTGWISNNTDEAQELLDHSSLPPNGKKENDKLFFILFHNDIIGYCQFYEGAFSENRIFLGFFGIIPSFQNKGIAQEAYNLLETEFINCGYNIVRINVGSRNIDALKFWLKNGYRDIVQFYKYENGFLDMNIEKNI